MMWITRSLCLAVLFILGSTSHAVEIVVGNGWESHTYSYQELHHQCGIENSVHDAWISQGCPGYFTAGPWLDLHGRGDLIVSVQLWLYGSDVGLGSESDVAGIDSGLSLNIDNYPIQTHKRRIKGKDKAVPPPTPDIFHYTLNLDQPLWMFENLVEPRGIEFRLFGLHHNIWAHLYKVRFLWLYRQGVAQ
jgi:hypothetical protein